MISITCRRSGFGCVGGTCRGHGGSSLSCLGRHSPLINFLPPTLQSTFESYSSLLGAPLTAARPFGPTSPPCHARFSRSSERAAVTFESPRALHRVAHRAACWTEPGGASARVGLSRPGVCPRATDFSPPLEKMVGGRVSPHDGCCEKSVMISIT